MASDVLSQARLSLADGANWKQLRATERRQETAGVTRKPKPRGTEEMRTSRLLGQKGPVGRLRGASVASGARSFEGSR